MMAAIEQEFSELSPEEQEAIKKMSPEEQKALMMEYMKRKQGGQQ
jgi:hypothetical protein